MGYILVLTTGIADSVWNGTVLASYLYELMGKSNAYAGYVEAAQGVTNLVVAIPLGFVADRGSKARVVAVGGLVVPIATAATAFAVIYGAQHVQHCFIAFYLFLGAMCLWGMSR
jgi:MFS family permease